MMQSGLRQRINIKNPYLLVVIFGIVVEIYAIYAAFAGEWEFSIPFIDPFLIFDGIFLMIAGIALLVFKKKPGRKGSIFRLIPILSPVATFMTIFSRIFMIDSDVSRVFGAYGFGYVLLFLFIPLQIVLMEQEFRGPRKYRKMIFKAEGKTVDEFYQVVISVLESNYDFHMTEDRKKGALRNKAELSGWIGGEDNPGRVGITISLRGNKEKREFGIRIEIAAPNEKRIQRISDELVRKLGFSNAHAS